MLWMMCQWSMCLGFGALVYQYTTSQSFPRADSQQFTLPLHVPQAPHPSLPILTLPLLPSFTLWVSGELGTLLYGLLGGGTVAATLHWADCTPEHLAGAWPVGGCLLVGVSLSNLCSCNLAHRFKDFGGVGYLPWVGVAGLWEMEMSSSMFETPCLAGTLSRPGSLQEGQPWGTYDCLFLLHEYNLALGYSFCWLLSRVKISSSF